MITCTVRFVTFTDGVKTVTEAPGRLERTESSCTLYYMLEGDEARILMTERDFTMERSGTIRLFARFASGEDTVMTTGFQTLGGDIPLRTHIYSCQNTSEGFLVLLDYSMIFGCETRHVRLEILVSEAV